MSSGSNYVFTQRMEGRYVEHCTHTHMIITPNFPGSYPFKLSRCLQMPRSAVSRGDSITIVDDGGRRGGAGGTCV